MKKITFLLFLSAFSIISAQTIHIVNTQSSFDTALNNASSGDIIEWENGTYSDIEMEIDVDGVTVQAETSGGVIFNGTSRTEIDGDNVTFSGLQFIGGNTIVTGVENTVDQTVITIDGSNALVTNINISEYTCWKYLRIRDESQNTEVSYCNFENRLNYLDQNIVQVDVSPTQPGYHNINHCSFKDFEGVTTGGDDGVEPIRIGAEKQSTYSSKSIVEYCYFTNCNGDGEVISHKAANCIYRYNTFENNEKGELVLRHGDRGIVYGNFFLNNKGGVRVQEGSDHVIYNNYFSGLTDRSLNLNASSDDTLDNILFAYNTVVDSGVVDIESDTPDEPTNITIANNIFSNPSSNNGLFEDVTGNETWIGNIANGDLGVANSEDFTITDPLLSLNSEGFYAISSTSPVINSAQSGYGTLPTFTDLDYDNDILLDVLAVARPTTETMKDVGCQEYNASSVLTVHVTEENTGPLYNQTTLSNDDFELITKNFEIYPNPLTNDNVTVKFNIEESSDVSVEVYDISGKKITTLIDEAYNVGSYTFNKKIDLVSGIYLLKVQLSTGINNAVKVEKLIKK